MRTPNSRTSVALIGAGFIADYHAAVLQSLPGLEIVAVCDPNLEGAKRLAERWKIADTYDSVEALLSGQRVDTAHILVPPSLHLDIAERLVEAGSGVFLEKPMGVDSAACTRLVAKATEKGVPIGVNHNATFHPAFRRLLADVAMGKFGKLEHVACVVNVPLRQIDSGNVHHWMFQEPANIVFEQAPHPFAQVIVLMGPAQRLQAMASGRRILAGNRIFYDTWQIHIECVRGTASVLLGFGREFAETSALVIGQDGCARLDLLNNTYLVRRRTRFVDPLDRALSGARDAAASTLQGAQNLTDYALSTLRLRGRSDAFYRSIHDSIKSFYQGSGTAMTPGLSGADGIAVVKLCEQVAQTVQPENHHSPRPIGAGRILDGPAEVVVVGATGFIGSHLVERLVSMKRRVRIMVRRPTSLPKPLLDLPIEVVAGDVSDEAAVSAAIAGARTVYHLAAGLADTWAEFERLNVQAARNVAAACIRGGVGRLVFTSSIAAYYLGNAQQSITESTALDPRPNDRSHYARAKIVCEELLTKEHQRGLPLVVIRPGVVVGERGQPAHSGVGWWPNPTHCLAWGGGYSPLPFVLVDDVVDALVSAMMVEGIEGQSFNLVGDVRLSAREYVAALREATGRDIKLHPRWLWQIQGADLSKWVIKWMIGRPENPLPSYHDLQSRRLLSQFDCAHTKRVLSWNPVSDSATFVERGIRWVARPAI